MKFILLQSAKFGRYFVNKQTTEIQLVLNIKIISFALILVTIPPGFGQALMINEFMASNGNTLADEDGEFADWIELYNPGTTSVDLSGWGLSDNESDLFKWVFPEETTIAPQSHLLIWASGKDRIPGQESPGLLLEFWDDIPGSSITSLINDPRFPDAPSSRSRLASAFQTPTNVADNYGQKVSGFIVPPSTGNYVFWIASDDSSELRLSTDDQPNNLDLIASVPFFTSLGQWDKYPSQQSSEIPLVAGQRYYIEALMKEGGGADHLTVRWQLPDGNIQEPIPSTQLVSPSLDQLHTNFSISASGETLSLTRPDGSIADQVGAIAVPRDISYGRLTDGAPTWHFFADATPNAANNSSPVVLPPSVAISEPRGFRNSPFNVTLSSDDPTATIRYTLDGSTPNQNSPIYDQPINIDGTTTLRASAVEPGMISLPPVTATWIFLNDVLTQGSATPIGWPADREINNHHMRYGLDTDIVANDQARLINGLSSIPSISIVTDLDNLFDADSGIYANSNRSHGWERPTSVELLDPTNNLQRQFQIDAGLRLRGAFSRNVNNPKHSFRLMFRSDYGSNSLDFPLFDEEGADSFRRVDLRTAQNYSWAGLNDPNNTFLREVFSRDSQRDMGMPYTRSRYYHLYLNGQYWGLYMTQERGGRFWAETYLGGDEEDWDTIKTSQPGYVTRASDGNPSAFNNLHQITIDEGFADSYADNYWRVLGLNPDGSPNPDFPKYLDQDNLINYMIVSHYVGDRDSPISLFMNPNRPNNMYGLLNRENPDGFKWLRHDAEHSLGVRPAEGVTWDPTFIGEGITAQSSFNPATLNFKLLEHPEYRIRFADLIQRHLYQDGALTPERAKARVLSRKAEIDTAIVGESARWGLNKTRDDHWIPAVDSILSYLDQRRDIIVEHYRNRGWFPSIDAPKAQLANGTLRLSSNSPFYYTVNHSDPRLIGGNAEPSATLVDLATSTPSTELISRGATWHYFDQGSEPPELNGLPWNHPDYPQHSWPSGGAIVGFAGTSPTNPVTTQTQRWITGTSGPQVTTTYLRHEFFIDDLGDFDTLSMEILRDDGAMIYLNGQELLRENMPPGPIDFSTEAATVTGGPNQTTYFERSSNATQLLQPGRNVIAVSVHQRGNTSSDKYFDFALTASGAAPYSAEIPSHLAASVRARSFENDEWSALNDLSTLADLPEPTTLHQWNFEDAQALLAPNQSIGGGQLTQQLGANTELVQNSPAQNFPSAHLRVNNPIGATLTWSLPTTGYAAINLQWETRRSGQGAGLQSIEITTDGVNWSPLITYQVFNDSPQLKNFDFSADPLINDNPNFAVRVTFSQGDGGTAGNNRFDNVTLQGTALPGTNQPPEIDTNNFPGSLQFTADPSNASSLNLNDYFTDPEDDPLSFTVVSSDPGTLSVAVSGSNLIFTALKAGEVTLTIEASDGNSPPLGADLRVLVLPIPHRLADGNYVFDTWDPLTPAATFPSNMIFLQSDRNDPSLDDELGFAYQIPPEDASSPEDTDFPYNASSRSRINGLGAEGIAFINTGRGRDLGAALLALDTTGQTEIQVSWTAGTILPNSRIYGLRLQYRIGENGEWSDVLDNSSPIEYVRSPLPGDVQIFDPVSLPAATHDQPLVHLRWRYHFLGGDSGPRAQLRLDDIQVNAGNIGNATQLGFEPLTFNYWQQGVELPPITVRALDANGLLDSDFSGFINLGLNGVDQLLGVTSLQAINGVATFTGLTPSTAEAITLGTFAASSPSLSPTTSTNVKIVDQPVFLPPLSDSWNLDQNWTSSVFPNAPSAASFIPPATTENRNINLTGPVTIGELTIDNTDSPWRNRIRDQEENHTLTFSNPGQPAAINIVGNGAGFIELEIEAGTILASDLIINVEPITGDTDYGALRLRAPWFGSANLTKTGPGRMTLTGGDKLLSGQLSIEQGVVSITESSTPPNLAQLNVTPGGQLRLISTGTDRQYALNAPLHLAGNGRTEFDIPVGQHFGQLGALRFDPLSNDNSANLIAPIHLTGDEVSIHVDGTRNTLTLPGNLSGTAILNKSGGGTLDLNGSASPNSLPSIELSRGSLLINGDYPNTEILTDNETLISGTGRSGNLSGTGTLMLEANQILHANSVNGMNYQFAATSDLAPSGGILHLGSPVPIQGGLNPSNQITFYLDQNSPTNQRFRSGFFVPNSTDPAPLLSALQNAALTIYSLDADGPHQWAGQNYSLYHGPEPTFHLAKVTIDQNSGYLTELQFGSPPALDYLAWVAANFSPQQASDPSISGPNAQPVGDGNANLLRYALGRTPAEPISPSDWFSGTDQNEQFFIQFNRSTDLPDINYIIETSTDLNSWDILFSDDSQITPNSHGNQHRVTLPPSAPDTPARFTRLRIQPSTN